MLKQDVAEAIEALVSIGTPISQRNVLRVLGRGSRRDVGRYMRELAAESGDIAIEDDETEEDTGDELLDSAEDAPAPEAASIAVPGRGAVRRTTAGEHCTLCHEPVAVNDMIATILSCMASISDIELACPPIRQLWHRPCLLLWVEAWKERHRKEHRP